MPILLLFISLLVACERNTPDTKIASHAPLKIGEKITLTAKPTNDISATQARHPRHVRLVLDLGGILAEAEQIKSLKFYADIQSKTLIAEFESNALELMQSVTGRCNPAISKHFPQQNGIYYICDANKALLDAALVSIETKDGKSKSATSLVFDGSYPDLDLWSYVIMFM